MSGQYYYDRALTANYSQQQYGALPQTYQTPPTQQPTQSFRDHLRALPMFPLLTEAEAQAKQKVLQTSAELYSQQQPEPKLSAFDEVTLGLLDAGTGGVTNVRKMENTMIRVAAGSTASLAAGLNTVVLTRWAYIPDDSGRETRGVVLVDVIQCRSSVPWAFKNNPAYVKAGSSASEAVTLIVFGKDVKIKGDKMWSKKLTTKDVDEVLLVQGKGSQSRMEPLTSVQVTVSPIEFAEALKRFENGWKVPRL